MDAFRSIEPMTMAMNGEPRISTSNTGHLRKHTIEAKMRGLNKLFYSMLIKTRFNDTNELVMLESMNKPPQLAPLILSDFLVLAKSNNQTLLELSRLTKEFVKYIKKTAEVEDTLSLYGKTNSK
jgi:26S proteasome regulatory subunit N11